MTALLADVVVWPIFVVGGAMLVAGIAAAVGVVWLGIWLVRRSQRPAESVSEDEW